MITDKIVSVIVIVNEVKGVEVEVNIKIVLNFSAFYEVSSNHN